MTRNIIRTVARYALIFTSRSFWMGVAIGGVFFFWAQVVHAATIDVPVSLSGYVRNLNVSSETFTSLRNGSGTSASEAEIGTNLGSLSVSNQYHVIDRGILIFPSFALPDGATVTSATLHIFGKGSKPNDFSQNVQITSVETASNSAIDAGDYAVANYGSTQLATAISVTDWNTSGWNAMPLTADGLAALNPTGYTKIAVRLSGDVSNTAPTWASNGQSNALGEPTSGNDAYLSIEYQEAPEPPPPMNEQDTITTLFYGYVLFFTTMALVVSFFGRKKR